MSSFWSSFVDNLTNSPLVKLAALGALDALVEAKRPSMRRHGHDIMVQVDPRTMSAQIDYVNRVTGHTTIRHTPPAALDAGMVPQLQPVSALWDQIKMSQQMNDAANAAQNAADQNQQNQNN